MEELEKKVKELEFLLERAKGIMVFHAMRCPMNPINNFSGTEEHCSEYRSVIKTIEKALKKESPGKG